MTFIVVPLYRKEGNSRWGVDVVREEFAYVDEDDTELVASNKWRLHSSGYACYQTKDRVTVLMHRVILGVQDTHIHIDHINHNKLDNRRANLRAGTQTDNNRNSLGWNSRFSDYLGVYKHRNKWKAAFRNKHLGVFDTQEEAALAYITAKERFEND